MPGFDAGSPINDATNDASTQPASDSDIRPIDASGSPGWSEVSRVGEELQGLSEHEPSVAVDGRGAVAVMWQRWLPSERSIGLAYRVSFDAGETWETLRHIQVPTASNIMANGRLAAHPAGGFVMVWVSTLRGLSGRSNLHAWSARIEPGASEMNGAVEVSDPNAVVGIYDLPSLSITDDGEIHVAYARASQDFRDVAIEYAHSPDGLSWSRQTLQDGPRDSFRNGVSLCMAGNEVRAVWFDTSLGGVVLASRTADGWSTPTVVQSADETGSLVGIGSSCHIDDDAVWVFYVTGNAPGSSRTVPLLSGLRVASFGLDGLEQRVQLDSVLAERFAIIPRLERMRTGETGLVAYVGSSAGDEFAEAVLWTGVGLELAQEESLRAPIRLETDRSSSSWLGDWLDIAFGETNDFIAVVDNSSGASQVVVLRKRR